MAATITKGPTSTIPGAERRTSTVVQLDNSYASGGETVTAKQLGLRVVDDAIATVVHGSESSEIRAIGAEYDAETHLLHVIDSATGKEVASTKDLSKVKVKIIAFGR